MTPSASWEEKCNRCGLCCHEKTIIGNEVIFDMDSYCEFYDPKTHQCTIYLERLEKSNRCKRVTWSKAMFASYLPDECAYVQWARSHHLRFAIRRRIRFVGGNREGSGDEEDDTDDPLCEVEQA
jgi:uncharacterized protein